MKNRALAEKRNLFQVHSSSFLPAVTLVACVRVMTMHGGEGQPPTLLYTDTEHARVPIRCSQGVDPAAARPIPRLLVEWGGFEAEDEKAKPAAIRGNNGPAARDRTAKTSIDIKKARVVSYRNDHDRTEEFRES